MADMDKLKDRLRALLEKTTDRGCTEAEAEAAAAMAARLMTQHGISPEDLVMERAEAETTSRSTVVDRLWLTLATLTGCVCVREVGIGARMRYLGRQPGPTIAGYMHLYLHRHIEAAVRAYQRTPEYKRKRKGASRRRACEAFRAGMAVRLERTLQQHFGRPDPAALEAAARYRDGQYAELQSDELKTPSRRHSHALTAGYAAGADVQIRDAVGGGPAGLIGRE